MNPTNKNSLSNHYIIKILFSKNQKKKSTHLVPEKNGFISRILDSHSRVQPLLFFRVPNNKENNQESNNQKNPIPFFPTFL